jgi:hypothetical protein
MHPILDLGLLISDMGFRISDMGSVANHNFCLWQLVSGYWLLAPGCWHLVILGHKPCAFYFIPQSAIPNPKLKEFQIESLCHLSSVFCFLTSVI